MTTKSTGLYFGLRDYLQTAFKMWLWSKHRDEITGTWNKFLTSNFGISDSYSRQLRKVSKKLGKYKRLHSVAIPFRELYRRRIDIQLMLEGDLALANHWPQPIVAAHTKTTNPTMAARTETNMDCST